MRSLTLKLILAFLLISVIGTGLAAVLARVVTGREFDRFIMDRARGEFVVNAAAYYQTRGSWVAADDYFRQLYTIQESGATQRQLQFVLVDQSGAVITPGQRNRADERISAKELTRGKPVVVDGRQVGTVLDAGRTPELNDREAQYLASTNQALALAAFGAMAIALLLGVFLASNLTRPLRDLTHAIQAMSRGELKQQVPVRSSDELGTLTQAFNQMSADLAHSNELRRQMTADIAHDLRTPLTVITGYIEALRDGVLKPTPARFEAMFTEAQHLRRLVEDLRTLSLADAGELPMQRQPVAPRGLLDRLAAAYAPQAAVRQIALEVVTEPDLPEIHVDPERMAQVLGNLISNALRYTSDGGRIVLGAQIKMYRNPPDCASDAASGNPPDCAAGSFSGQAVVLTVQDNGEGIAANVLPHVFDRFYRGESARSQPDGESGLGLAIAKSIVEAHGGKISAASTLGQGTTFTIILPVTA